MSTLIGCIALGLFGYLSIVTIMCIRMNFYKGDETLIQLYIAAALFLIAAAIAFK